MGGATGFNLYRGPTMAQKAAKMNTRPTTVEQRHKLPHLKAQTLKPGSRFRLWVGSPGRFQAVGQVGIRELVQPRTVEA